MPFYEYTCDSCGPFAEMRSLAAFAAPCACPGCGALAERNLLAAPALGSGARTPAPGGASATRHAGACGCCAPRRGLRADAVGRSGA